MLGTVSGIRPGSGRRGLAWGYGRRCLGVGPVPELRGGHGADGQGRHDQHEVAEDRGIEPGLALVQAEAVLPELEIFLDRPAQPGGPDQPGLGQQLPLGDVAVVKGQLTGSQVPAHQQVVTRRGGGDPRPGVPALALGAFPGRERTSQPRLPFSRHFTASLQVTSPSAKYRIILTRRRGRLLQ